jgi:hypothetical protein
MAIPSREFIRVWQGAASLAEVAQKVRRNMNACRVRAYWYRRHGVPLKEFPPVVVEPTDWGELAEYAASLLPEEPRDDGADHSGGNASGEDLA